MLDTAEAPTLTFVRIGAGAPVGPVGTAVTNLTSNSSYPNSPTGSEQLTSLESPTNAADNYGSRIRGYIHPPASGAYTFWLASDDSGASYGDIEYAFYLDQYASIYLFESGTYRTYVGKYAAGDVFRVAIEGGQVRYRVNGTLVHTSAVAPAQYPYALDTALNSTGTAISTALVAGTIATVNQ